MSTPVQMPSSDDLFSLTFTGGYPSWKTTSPTGAQWEVRVENGYFQIYRDGVRHMLSRSTKASAMQAIVDHVQSHEHG